MNKINVAKALKSQGIKGEIKFDILTRSADDILSASELWLGETMVTIETLRESSGFLYIKFNEFNSIQEVEAYKNKFLSVNKSELEETLEEGEYFIDDLINKPVEFESGEQVGVLVDVSNYGAADVITIKKSNGKEVLLANVEGVIIDVTEEKVVLCKSKFDEVSV